MHAPLIAVPQHGTLVDVLAERYRAAFDKVKGGRAQWIDGTLELAAVLAELRGRYPDHREYSRWLQRNELEFVSDAERAALLGFTKDPAGARELLERSTSTSWRYIWENRPNKSPRTPSSSGKGPPRAVSRRSGASKRKRAARVPTAMQDNTEPQPRPAKHLPPPAPGKRVSDYALTPEQVDPDFKGTHLEFKTKYGHVTLQPKQKIEHNKRQEALSVWLGAVSEHERTARVMFTALTAVDPATLREWMSKPAKLAKFQMWCKSIKTACDELLKC